MSINQHIECEYKTFLYEKQIKMKLKRFAIENKSKHYRIGMSSNTGMHHKSGPAKIGVKSF